MSYKYSENEYGYIVLGSPFFYRQYKKGKKDPIPYTRWRDMVRETMAEIWRAMAEELWRFEVPYLNNTIFILEIMGEGVPMNWRMTVRKRKKIVNNNLHTNGRLFKIAMRQTHKSSKMTRIYKFIPLRGRSDVEFIGKRGLAAYINRCSKDPFLADFRGHIC